MRVVDLQKFFEEHPDIEELLVSDTDDVLHDCKAAVQPEVFDGFDTVYPASVKLIMTD